MSSSACSCATSSMRTDGCSSSSTQRELHLGVCGRFSRWLTSDRLGKQSAAKKRTIVMTNSPAVAMLLREAQCRSEHQHTPLLEGRAGPCQQYPDQFCELICEGIKREKDTLQWRDTVGRRHQLLACSHQWRAEVPPMSDVSKTFGQLLAVQKFTEKLATPPEEASLDQLYSDVTFVDDVTGRILNKAATVKARKKEIQCFKEKGVYTKRAGSRV